MASLSLGSLRLLRVAQDEGNPAHQLLIPLQDEAEEAVLLAQRTPVRCVCGADLALTPLRGRTTEYVRRGLCQPELRFRIEPVPRSGPRRTA